MDHQRQVVAEIVTGSQLAFRGLYEAHHRELYRYALRFLKSPELAEDVVQDAFVKIWEKRESLSSVQNLRAFLFTVCRNGMLTFFERASREASLRNEIIHYAALSHVDTEEEVSRYEILAEEAIGKLPPQRQQIFRLCRLEGKSYDEVAKELGISKYTVSDHLVKASKFLREYLSAYVDYSLVICLLPYLFSN